jgi:hypothetical protein
MDQCCPPLSFFYVNGQALIINLKCLTAKNAKEMFICFRRREISIKAEYFIQFCSSKFWKKEQKVIMKIQKKTPNEKSRGLGIHFFSIKRW